MSTEAEDREGTSGGSSGRTGDGQDDDEGLFSPAQLVRIRHMIAAHSQTDPPANTTGQGSTSSDSGEKLVGTLAGRHVVCQTSRPRGRMLTGRPRKGPDGPSPFSLAAVVLGYGSAPRGRGDSGSWLAAGTAAHMPVAHRAGRVVRHLPNFAQVLMSAGARRGIMVMV